MSARQLTIGKLNAAKQATIKKELAKSQLSNTTLKK